MADSCRNRCLILQFSSSGSRTTSLVTVNLPIHNAANIGPSSSLAFSYLSPFHLRQATRHLTTNLPPSGDGSSSLFRVTSTGFHPTLSRSCNPWSSLNMSKATPAAANLFPAKQWLINLEKWLCCSGRWGQVIRPWCGRPLRCFARI